MSLPKSLKTGLFFLSDEFAVGVDLKFSAGATFFVLGPNEIKKEDQLQRIARGAR